MTLLEVKNFTKVFGKKQKAALEMVKQGKSKTEILKKTGATVGVYDANFSIQEGEIFVIMGLSGSGKSTLVRMFNRLIEPSSGSIVLDGQDISKMNAEELRQVRRHDMNMVFQSFALFPHKTILENTEFGLELRGVSKEERQAAAEKALENAGLLACKDQYPDQLSGGMQQRVSLARALANKPKILLMDEAFQPWPRLFVVKCRMSSWICKLAISKPASLSVTTSTRPCELGSYCPDEGRENHANRYW